MNEKQKLIEPKIKKVLQVHNRYVWSPGGEIAVLEAEAELLKADGIEVDQYFYDNKDDDLKGIVNKIKAAKDCIYNPKTERDLYQYLIKTQPDIVHVHNTFVHLSPSVFNACQKANIPVVQSVHNFRMLCAQAALLRDGIVCRECLSGSKLPALKHRCYRGSLVATIPIVLHQVVNQKTFTHSIDSLIMLSEFMKEIFIRAGFPEEKLLVKEHSAVDPGLPDHSPRAKKMVYVGRLVDEKGPHILTQGWKMANLSDWELHILGEGPMKDELINQTKDFKNITWHGWQDREQVVNQISTSQFLLNTSTCYESFGLTIVEALACGTPSVVPGHGAMPAIADSPQIGLTFEPGNPESLSETLRQITEISEENWNQRSIEARSRYEKKYVPKVNLNRLLEIYTETIESYRGR